MCCADAVKRFPAFKMYALLFSLIEYFEDRRQFPFLFRLILELDITKFTLLQLRFKRAISNFAASTHYFWHCLDILIPMFLPLTYLRKVSFKKRFVRR